jgi:transposase
VVLEEAHDSEQLIARVAALDIGKAELMCCVRVPGATGKRLQEVAGYKTMTRSLLVLADRLGELGVTRVVMESTSDYWKPVFYVLEAYGFDCRLVNAREAKHVPGRPKTDRLDAVWLCKLAERDLLRPSFVPPPPIRQLRDLTRYRADLVAARTAEKNRVDKLLEDAQIKLSVVASDIFGVSGRAMMAALIGGERDPQTLADLARASLRAKRGELVEAFTGRFNDHHGFLLGKMLGRINQADADIVEVETRIAAAIVPFAVAAERLAEITGVGRVAAWVLIAEIGTDMSRFPTPGHLVSWARFAPGVRQSAGRSKGRAGTGRGNRYLAQVLGDIAVCCGRSDSFLGERYRRIARRRGSKRAIVAVGRSVLIIVWHLLQDPDTRFADLGADFYPTHHNTQRAMRNHVRQLQALGYQVTLEPVA